MVEDEVTTPTDRFPRDVVEAVLAEQGISSQALWLLFSLEQYGWRAEKDAIRVLLEGQPRSDDGHYRQHAPLLALNHLFGLVDKLWRLVYAMRAHRAGKEFLDDEEGYLAGGYKLERKLRALCEVAEDEWRTLLSLPSHDEIAALLAANGATADQIEERVAFADGLPRVLVKNMVELSQYVGREASIAGPLPETSSLRDVDSKHRHGAPVVYHECSPDERGWRAVDSRTATDTREETVGLIATPPENDAALINLIKYDKEAVEGLLNTSEILAARVLLLTRAHLRYVDARLVAPLATVTQYD